MSPLEAFNEEKPRCEELHLGNRGAKAYSESANRSLLTLRSHRQVLGEGFDVLPVSYVGDLGAFQA